MRGFKGEDRDSGGRAAGIDVGRQFKELSDLRPKEREARAALARQVNTELRPTSD